MNKEQYIYINNLAWHKVWKVRAKPHTMEQHELKAMFSGKEQIRSKELSGLKHYFHH